MNKNIKWPLIFGLPGIFLFSFLMPAEFINGKLDAMVIGFNLSLSIGLIILLVGTFPFTVRHTISLNKIDFCTILFGFYILINYVFNSRSIYFDNLFTILLGFAFYIMIRVTFKNIPINYINKYVPFIFVAIILCQLIFIFLHLFFVDNQELTVLGIQGTFDNSGPFSIWLVVTCPIFIQLVSKTHNKTKYLFLLLCVLVIGIIIYNQSRTAILALVICSFFPFKHFISNKVSKDYRKFKYPILVLFAIIVTFVTRYLVIFKLGSVKGRLLIWNIGFEMFRKNIFLGLGLNGFDREFGIYSSKFFSSSNAHNPEYLTAKVNYAFNDYLQILVEQGIVGLIIFIVLFYFVIYTFEETKIKFKYSLYILYFCLFFSYPLECPAIWITFILLLAVISNSQKKYIFQLNHPISHILSYTILIFFSAVIFYKSLIIFKSKRQVFSALKAVDDNEITKSQAISILKDNVQTLYYDYTMLLPLAKLLSSSGNFISSNHIISLAKRSTCDPYLYLIEGNNFYKTGRFKEAEASYIFSTTIYPTLIYPKYMLVNFYLAINKKSDAIIVAKEILSQKIKVRSSATEQIQAEMMGVVSK